jgi:hypothetical protein
MTLIKTSVGTLSYPHFFTPRERALGNTNKVYSGVLLFTPQNMKSPAYKEMKEVIEKQAAASFPKLILGRTVRTPIRKADEKENIPDEFETFINAWSKERPGLVDSDLNYILDSNDVWPGQWARFSVVPFAYDKNGNKGIGLYLHNVQIVRSEGLKRLDGRKGAAETFDDDELGEDDDQV